MFIGRNEQLAVLDELLEGLQTRNDRKPGHAILIRGRRRVGKSRLVEEFVQRANVPHLFYAAAGRTVEEELRLFVAEVLASDLPEADSFRGVTFETWDTALRFLVSALPEDGASIVVIDDLPYLIDKDPGFEGTLQTVFDRFLSPQRVLLVGIGSDLAMMEMLNDYGRPFHQRATEMIVPPLSPAEVAEMLELPAAEAMDAYLVSGGLPLILAEWKPGWTMWEYLEWALQRPTSALLVSAERALAAEFPTEAQARLVLSTIGGAGERTFTTIGQRAGIQATQVTRATKLLGEKRMVDAVRPLSTRKSSETRYRVADPYLRFWLSFIEPQMPRIERGGGLEVLERIREGWSSWSGRAIEPVIHEALDRLRLPLGPKAAAGVVGGYWTRTNDVEIDVVIADRPEVAKQIYAVGSIKWKGERPFDGHDLGELLKHRGQLPGADGTTPLVAVTRSGYTAGTVPDLHVLGPEDLLEAWRRR
ncbi:ATP-binding protein [Nocardioides bigeumensis]|uniref:ATP-binding protein n=1 Tax=Nocardioides bigeumensis TaxID=433657 RepID=A0ABN2YUK8_9ACTN